MDGANLGQGEGGKKARAGGQRGRELRCAGGAGHGLVGYTRGSGYWMRGNFLAFERLPC